LCGLFWGGGGVGLTCDWGGGGGGSGGLGGGGWGCRGCFRGGSWPLEEFGGGGYSTRWSWGVMGGVFGGGFRGRGDGPRGVFGGATLTASRSETALPRGNSSGGESQKENEALWGSYLKEKKGHLRPGRGPTAGGRCFRGNDGKAS